MNGLDLDRAPGDTRVAVAMSGGVDSSTTAALMVEAGYDVFGITLKLYDTAVAATAGTCCAGTDIRDAAAVCDRLGIRHKVLDLEDVFKRDVIDAFAESYLAGETPVPCVACNRTVKFRDMLTAAREDGADLLATGHYVDWRPGPQLWRGADEARDQSYFLFATTKEQLDILRFPLGGLDKAETRRHAARFDLPVAKKPDSQDICFVPKGHYSKVVQKLRPGRDRPGEIVDPDGDLLGFHRGLTRYTVGQRRGLGIGGLAEPLYVVRLEPDSGRLVVGPEAALHRTRFDIDGVNWLGDGDTPPAEFDCAVKVRSTQQPMPARVRMNGGGTAEVALETPHPGIAPGQACVFYRETRCLGGGWIRSTPHSPMT